MPRGRQHPYSIEVPDVVQCGIKNYVPHPVDEKINKTDTMCQNCRLPKSHHRAKAG